jgi:hypothetical protein
MFSQNGWRRRHSSMSPRTSTLRCTARTSGQNWDYQWPISGEVREVIGSLSGWDASVILARHDTSVADRQARTCHHTYGLFGSQ